MTITRASLVIAVASLSALSGCYRWTSIQPNFARGDERGVGKARIGGVGGEVVESARVRWPLLVGIENGQPVRFDLRETSAERRELTPGGTAAIVVPSVLGGLLITGGILIGVIAAGGAGVGYIPN